MCNLFGQILVGVSLLMMAGTSGVLASETEHAKPKKEAEAPPLTPGIALPIGEDMDPVRAYCTNIRDKAADARAAAQTKQLTELEKQIEEKIKALEVREAEVKSWVDKQQKIREAATSSLVEIYAGMDAEVAAKQLASLDPKLASSVIRQLKPRVASAILNEMKPETANLLVKTIASAAAKETPSK